MDEAVRRAVIADAPAVTELVAAAYAKYLQRMPFRPRPMDADYGVVLGETDSWVVEVAGRIRAVLVCVVEPDHVLVENLAVHPDAQGRGLGRRLLELAEQHARANGLTEVRLYTNEVMVENLRLYDRRGYVETGRESRDGFGRVFLAKQVRPVVTVRDAVPADAGEIFTVQRAAWVTEAQLHGALDLPPLTQTLSELRVELAEQRALVAVDGHRIVGIVRARLAEGTWHIGRLGVVPDRQGEGIGRRLLAAIEAAAPPEVTTFALFTGPNSATNVAMYERAGYRRVDSDDGLIHLRKDAAAHDGS